jgi:PAS domain S-box-containing protein
MIGRPITVIIPPDRLAEEEFALRQIRAGARVDHFETVRRRKDGSLVEVAVTVSPIRSAEGEIIGASKVAREIGERRRMEREALRLAAIVEWSSDAIVAKDLQGVIQSWNRGAERLFGYSAEEAVGRSITMIIPEDRLGEETHVLSSIAAGRAIEHFETIRRRKDGRLIEISVTVSPIRARTGEVIGASKIARDITEQKRLQREVEEASRSKDEFLATLSHELRTPLNTVLGYSAMLRAGSLDAERRDKAIETITRNAELLTTLVNDVLDTSRIITGKVRLQLQRCDVAVIMYEAITAVASAVETKSLRLTTDVQPGLIVQGDPDRLRQVFWNLLSNAVKFTPMGGRLHVLTERAGPSVRIVVQDTGIGIAPESLPFVFQRFWQVDPGKTREHGGLGLGLALARHFVELHGGEISAESEGLGRGATFQVTLPASA